MPKPLDSHWKTSAILERLKREKNNGPLRFIVMGDSRPERFLIVRAVYPWRQEFERFLQIMQTLPFDFSMHLGDFVPTGLRGRYHAFFKTLKTYNVAWPFLTTIGNHEIKDHGLSHYREAFGTELDYYFDFKGFRFIVAATMAEAKGLGPHQLSWLESALKTPLRKIVFTHMPPAQLVKWSGAAIDKWLAKIFGGGFVGGSAAFTDLMAEHGVERVYVGHLHGFGLAQYKGVRYILSGGAGSPLYHWHPVRHRIFHFLLVTLDNVGAVKETLYFLDGTTVPIEKFPVYPDFVPDWREFKRFKL